MIEIKTSKEIWRKVQTESEIWKNHRQTMQEYLDEVETNWLQVNQIIKWIDKLRKSNDMWRYSVDECFGMLEDEITTSSQMTHNTKGK